MSFTYQRVTVTSPCCSDCKGHKSAVDTRQWQPQHFQVDLLQNNRPDMICVSPIWSVLNLYLDSRKVIDTTLERWKKWGNQGPWLGSWIIRSMNIKHEQRHRLKEKYKPLKRCHPNRIGSSSIHVSLRFVVRLGHKDALALAPQDSHHLKHHATLGVASKNVMLTEMLAFP